MHPIQGIGAGFVPNNLNTHIYDEIIAVSNADSMDMARRLAKEEGVFAGISSGRGGVGRFAGCAARRNAGKLIVVIIPSTGERYLSPRPTASTQIKINHREHGGPGKYKEEEFTAD